MAVPKKKRYRQVVKFRRTKQIENNLNKKKVSLTKFSNHIVTSLEYCNLATCDACLNKKIEKKLCKFCYNPVFIQKVLRPKRYQEFEE
jgi:hypothetical protein